jgi:hypothetical protein
MLNVWIERVRSMTGPSPRGPIPKYLSLRVPRIRTASIDQPSARRPTSRYLRPGDRRLRYIMSTGTLAPLWQRQNDANSELAAPRRTTAANQTLAAGSAPSRLPQSYDFVPSSCYTTRAPELREAWYLVPGSPRARPPAGRPWAAVRHFDGCVFGVPEACPRSIQPDPTLLLPLSPIRGENPRSPPTLNPDSESLFPGGGW